MYGGYQELDDFAPAYRDTVAPLLIKRLSLSHSPSLQAVSISEARQTVSSLSLRSAAAQTGTLPVGNKQAPSFLEFSRALQDRRNELVSPMSGSSSDYHRQAAYDQLAPPSPQVSSIEQSISITHTPPLPDAMSGTISDIDDSDLLPPPLRLSCSSPPSPLLDGWDSHSQIDSSAPTTDEVVQGAEGGGNWSENWLAEGFVSRSPVSEPSRHDAESSTGLENSLTENEQERIISYAEAKYPGMKKTSSFDMIKSGKSSARSSLQQNVNSLLRSLSLSSRSDGKQEPFPQKQLAIPATPYQVYGAEIWSNKARNKREKESQQRRQRGKSFSLLSAYQSGQSQFVGVLEGAKQKLTRKSSQKRRRKLKQSIILVGPKKTEALDALERHERESDLPWI
ncbi:hypothetical protein HRR78_000499 [Exophiala dermatitidis]|nr:hypothetical protein HRR75_001406 [Exophiala dermatitidis]KAJ4559976.1 hypothetical protein HRR78_000499 [Exophiala dermatitidis]